MAEEVVSWKPLGVLLVDRGLLTLEQLDDALEEQARTGERLGAILVQRKVIAGAVLTTILAEQIGVELETQGGYGSGLFSKMAKRNGLAAPTRRERTPALPSYEDETSEMSSEQEDLQYELSALRAELESLRARNAELEAKLALAAKKKPASRRKSAKSAA
ncbi:MAG TPA: hypothetical protein VFR32_11510 [Gaiellaceae bacterium]|nr:hypothetical protein [Gaiellaceae bacterium]